MLNIRDTLYFYRLRPWGHKLTSFRALGYTFFGYLMAGRFDGLLIALNTLAILGILTFSFLVNDYYDYKLRGDKNFLAEKIEKGELNGGKLLFYFLLPLILIVPLIFTSQFIKPVPSFALLFLLPGFILTILYSIPFPRLKERRVLAFLSSPISVLFLFLQGYFLFKLPEISILLLSIIIFLFHCYLESLHIIKDTFDPREVKKMELKTALKFAMGFPAMSLVVSILLSPFNPVFLVTVPFALVRMNIVRKIKPENVQKMRANLFSPLLGLYEFGIYGLFGVLHIF